MRIIGGRYRGQRLHPPSNLPVRPTTDMAKEALFNIFQNQIDFEGASVLDLFAGTGSITFEFASRGAQRVLAVDKHGRCVRFIREAAKELGAESVEVAKADVGVWLKAKSESFDIIFADPPYDLPMLPQLPDMVLESELLVPGGLLVVEHPSTRVLNEHPDWQETRKYGYSSFSFYRRDE